MSFAAVGLILFALFVLFKWFSQKFLPTSTDAVSFRSTFRGDSPYVAQYRNRPEFLSRPPMPTAAEAREAASGLPRCSFLLTAKQQLSRDYVILVDRSGSMSSGTRWQDAARALRQLAPQCCAADPDGVDLVLFDHDIQRFEGVKTAAEVDGIFRDFAPRGSTNLALALHSIFERHFRESVRGATSVLVLCDGEADSNSEVIRILRRAANSVKSIEELSVSFIQIGDDKRATKFLKMLDDDLGTKHDIVDALSANELGKMSFSELVARSIYD